MAEFVIGGVVGDEESFFITWVIDKNTCCGSSDNSGSSDGGLDDWDVGSEFAFESGVEVIGAACCN